MVKQLVSLVFLAAFALQTFNRSLIVVDYVANMATYIQNCENKAKPQLHCSGKCQMMKKLANENSQDKQNPERKAENKNEWVLSSKSFTPQLPGLIASLKGYNGVPTRGDELKMPRSFFHPPSVVV